MMTEDLEWHTRYKVGRVLRKYDLTALHAELPVLWLGEAGNEELSLRDIAKHINVELLSAELERTGNAPLEGEAENAYELLTDDTVSAGVRTQQRNRLERMGVDVEELESDFVTHQAVHTYLTEALGVSKQREQTDPVRKHDQRINRLRNRTAAVLEDSVSALRSSGDVSVGSFDVVVDLGIYCQDCNQKYEVTELLEHNGCDCQQTTSTDR
jgi:hypothetical protein